MAKSNAERQAAFRERAAVTKHDPLLAAVIDKLPGVGPWPSAERAAWFDLMAKACDVAYGPAVPSPLIAGSGPRLVSPAAAAASRYFIDKAGFAMVETWNEYQQAHVAEPLSPYDIPEGVKLIDQRIAAVVIQWKEGVLPADETKGIALEKAA